VRNTLRNNTRLLADCQLGYLRVAILGKKSTGRELAANRQCQQRLTLRSPYFLQPRQFSEQGQRCL
jgi:hypothetical protein